MANSSSPHSVMLVGSIPLGSAKEVFTKVCKELPGCIRAIPDGETGERSNYVQWQTTRLPKETLRPFNGGTDFPASGMPEYSPDDVKPTLYDKAAIESYAEFVELRNKGIIPKEMRFQVGLPTAFNVVHGHCKPEAHSSMGPLYARRIRETILSILDNIPHEDLIIQWDLCLEVMALEHEAGRFEHDFFKPFFSPVRSEILRRIGLFNSYIPPEVCVGFHLCYGDDNRKHFIEPVDLGLVVDFANDIMATLKDKNRIEYIHMPVPRDRTDAAYLEPLNRLQLNDSRLYLGLIHANDEEGTRKRIETARAVSPYPFGVATECGMGRTPAEELDSILTISRDVVVKSHI